MTDRLAELGALQYAVENLSTAGTNPNRLGLAGYIHAAYTDYQAWAAANPGVNPNRLSARGRLYGYFYDNGDPDAVIKALFANNEVGAWYDPSDVKAYTDSAVLGSELVTNGTFDSGTSGWSTPTNATITVVESGSVDIVKTNTATTSISARDITTVIGKWYKASFNIKAISGTSVTPFVGVYTTSAVTYPYTVVPIGNTVTFSVHFLAASTLTEVRFGLVDGSAVDNTARFYDVSVKECTSFGVEPKLFQDRAGTTPVTADGQTVGLILDKSKGLALGPEFSNIPYSGTPTGSWVITGTSVTRNGGTTGTAITTISTNSATISKIYKVTITVTDFSGDSFIVRLNSSSMYAIISSNGTHSFYLPAGGTATVAVTFAAYAGTLGEATITNISVKELHGNHAVAPSDAARPLKTSTGAADWTNYDAVDDVLNTTFSSSLGSLCTVCRANVGAAPTILTAQTIGTSYADSTDHAGLIIINRALTGQETTDVTAWLTAKGAT